MGLPKPCPSQCCTFPGPALRSRWRPSTGFVLRTVTQGLGFIASHSSIMRQCSWRGYEQTSGRTWILQLNATLSENKSNTSQPDNIMKTRRVLLLHVLRHVCVLDDLGCRRNLQPSMPETLEPRAGPVPKLNLQFDQVWDPGSQSFMKQTL